MENIVTLFDSATNDTAKVQLLNDNIGLLDKITFSDINKILPNFTDEKFRLNAVKIFMLENNRTKLFLECKDLQSFFDCFEDYQSKHEASEIICPWLMLKNNLRFGMEAGDGFSRTNFVVIKDGEMIPCAVIEEKW